MNNHVKGKKIGIWFQINLCGSHAYKTKVRYFCKHSCATTIIEMLRALTKLSRFKRSFLEETFKSLLIQQITNSHAIAIAVDIYFWLTFMNKWECITQNTY